MSSRTDRFGSLLGISGVTISSVAARSGLSQSTIRAMRDGTRRVDGGAMRAARALAAEAVGASVAAFRSASSRGDGFEVYAEVPVARRARGSRLLRVTLSWRNGQPLVHVREWLPARRWDGDPSPTDVGVCASPELWHRALMPGLERALEAAESGAAVHEDGDDDVD